MIIDIDKIELADLERILPIVTGTAYSLVSQAISKRKYQEKMRQQAEASNAAR